MKVKQYLMIGLCICVFSLSACAAAPQANQRLNALQTAPGADGLPGAYSAPGANPSAQLHPSGAAPDNSRADNIKSQLAGLKEIKDVNVVVIGNSCLVGYTPTAASTDPNATKNLVASRCKQADSNIAGVSCGDTQDFNSRIAAMYNDLRSNKPAADMSSRFNDLVKMINPSAS